ncbi:MAG: hypothetical protein AABP62_16190 [Planctomycetota bacterium]
MRVNLPVVTIVAPVGVQWRIDPGSGWEFAGVATKTTGKPGLTVLRYADDALKKLTAKLGVVGKALRPIPSMMSGEVLRSQASVAFDPPTPFEIGDGLVERPY